MNYKFEIVVPLYGDCTHNLYNLINSIKINDKLNLIKKMISSTIQINNHSKSTKAKIKHPKLIP